MKKLMLLLIFTINNTAFAEIINCPTSKNFTFQEKPWKLLVEKNSKEKIPAHDDEKDFFNYDPGENVIEGHPLRGIYGMRFNYNASSSRAIKNENGITIQCNGTYESNECPLSWWSNCQHVKGNLEATLFLGNDYKFCMSNSNSSFYCKK